MNGFITLEYDICGNITDAWSRKREVIRIDGDNCMAISYIRAHIIGIKRQCIALQTTDPFSRQRGRLRKKNKVIVSRRKKSKIKSGQGSQREARYPDELVD
jgi:hypothetical protein